jgi:hypothetical protein
MTSPQETVPAVSFESPAFIPPTARLTALAMAALECGVNASDVKAYLSGRYSKCRPTSADLFPWSKAGGE